MADALTRDQLAEITETARRAAEAAVKASLRYFRRPIVIDVKADRSPVTQADREAEQAIVAVVRERFPDHALLTEESGELAGDARSRWVVDPLDGTRGFTRGATFWGPLVAFEHQGEIVAGAMALPALGEVYWAGRGLGAFCNGERLRVSSVGTWAEATLSLGELHHLLAPPHGQRVVALATSCAQSRAYGDLAACAMLLTGRADAWLETGVKLWDLAPLKILVEEAGGRFTDFAGRATAASGQALATNGHLHPYVLEQLAGP